MSDFGRKGPEAATVLRARSTGLGTFGGVFTPSILTILGVIMYLRLGWVVGTVGLTGSIVVFRYELNRVTVPGTAYVTPRDERLVRESAQYMVRIKLGKFEGIYQHYA